MLAVPPSGGNEKARCQGFFVLRAKWSVQWPDVHCLISLRARRDVERNLLIFLERLEPARALNSGEMGEHFFAAIVGLDEAEAFSVIEPLNRTGSHV